MKIQLVPIGNSKGIRIPKPLIEEYGLHGVVELEPTLEGLLVRNPRTVRDGWERSFAEMHQVGDDRLPDADWPSPSWDEKEWSWT